LTHPRNRTPVPEGLGVMGRKIFGKGDDKDEELYGWEEYS
jgi:hypothetical protein